MTLQLDDNVLLERKDYDLNIAGQSIFHETYFNKPKAIHFEL